MSKEHDTIIDETVVFVARETGWSLEYIRAIPLSTLRRLVRELRYQKAVEDYRYLRGIAMALANWASSRHKSRKYRVEDFIGTEPTRKQLEKMEVTNGKSRQG